MSAFSSRIVVLLLCLSAAVSIVYFPITKYDIYDPATGGRTGDVAQYVKMAQGVPLDEVPKPYRYRVLTPWLARHVPFLPDRVAALYDITPDKIAAFRFGVINMLALAGTGFLLFLFCRGRGFNPLESLLAGFLFFTCFVTVNMGGVPLVDAGSWFFLLFGIRAAVENRIVALTAAFTLGLFAKETTLVVLPAIWVLEGSSRRKLAQTLCCLPALAAYVAFRVWVLPTETGYNYSVGAALRGVLTLLTDGKRWLWMVIDGGLAFAMLWPLALHGWARLRKADRRDPLYRLAFLVPGIMAIPFLIGSNIGRVWFLAFPAVIPLALVSLRAVLGSREHVDSID